MNQNAKIFISGHQGMVGSAIVRLLKQKGYNNLVTCSSSLLDLRDQRLVNKFFQKENPDYVIMAAAKVGGIYANNTFKADFIYDNLLIELNTIHAAFKANVKKLLFLGSSCIYPKLSPQPIKEEYLLSGYLEPTNQPYAIAKIAGIELCKAYRDQYGCNFISAMPTNLYGTNDNYHPENAHVLPSLVRKMVEAKKLELPNVYIWGTGNPKREFLHVDDLASACYFLLHYFDDADIINVGSGMEFSIDEVAHFIADEVNYTGTLSFDKSKPDGTPRKLLDSTKIRNLGWLPEIEFKVGVRKTIKEFKAMLDD
jgi:GDP-L-fucose synthase